jgi:hypothetical protein
MAATNVVTYQVDERTTVQFEIDPLPGFGPVATTGEIIATVHNAIGPAIAAARSILDDMAGASLDDAKISFGVKVTGKGSWAIARSANEGHFHVTLSSRPRG